MKPLTLRAFALLALLALAHSIKPFTADNVLSFTGASVHSLTALIPAAAMQRWQRTATLAAMMGQAWRADDEPAASAWQPVLLAVSLKPEPTMAVTCECAMSKRGRAATRRKAQVMLPAATAKLEESADESISLQDELADAAPGETPAVETFALPIPTTRNSKSLSFEAPLLAAPKPDACEMPAPSASEQTAPIPTVENELLPSVKPLSKRPASPLESEVQPIFSPAQTHWLIRLKQARQRAAKC